MVQYARIRCGTGAGFLTAVFMALAPAVAQQSTAAIGAVEYVAPVNVLHRPLHDRLKAERWLERMQGVVQHFRLPRTVTFKLDNCGGSVDAWFAHRTVAVCYEYLQVIVRRIEAGQLPAWLTREEALAGAFVDAILHEFSHALIAYLKLPVLGREEEAADHLSAFLMLRLAGPEAVGLVKGTANVYMSWMSYYRRQPQGDLGSGASRGEARAHPTAAQRLYNLVCIAVGADAAAYKELAAAVDLPADRAEDCAEEYAQLQRAYDALLKPHVNASAEPRARREIAFFATRR